MNEVRVTGDGSTTLFSRHFGEHYHSVFGAITESEIVFIRNGLLHLTKDPLIVFEIGFGTGLNAYLACLSAKQHKRAICYYAIEKYPLDYTILSSLNYTKILDAGEEGEDIFSLLHKAEWETPVAITSAFTLCKMKADMGSFDPGFNYDVIFFDAFAPDKQPEMWSREIFRRLYDRLNPGGILTTYCVKGQVKRMLKEAGFTIEKLPGPPGKREIMRAVKTQNQ
jgi:tRNA U34 5-methylaminomethyl-2-thiouridine-forming methyltransferase MnmC